MKMHIHIIPVDPTNPPTPPHNLGPPDAVLYHYTTVEKLRSIIKSGGIRPSNARIEPSEKPVVWFSSRPTWEPTATKCPLTGKLGQLVTASAQGGLARISVPPDAAPYIFSQLPRVAGTTTATCIGLLVSGLDLGADPDQWRFTPEPVPVSLFHEVELFDFVHDMWRAVDMAELACRN
jgi:hypothetical protein